MILFSLLEPTRELSLMSAFIPVEAPTFNMIAHSSKDASMNKTW